MTHSSENQSESIMPPSQGAELVLELIKEIRVVSGEGCVQKVLDYISEHYGCAPDQLKVTREEASVLNDRLFWIANEHMRRAALQPMCNR